MTQHANIEVMINTNAKWRGGNRNVFVCPSHHPSVSHSVRNTFSSVLYILPMEGFSLNFGQMFGVQNPWLSYADWRSRYHNKRSWDLPLNSMCAPYLFYPWKGFHYTLVKCSSQRHSVQSPWLSCIDSRSRSQIKGHLTWSFCGSVRMGFSLLDLLKIWIHLKDKTRFRDENLS